ncbi:cupredoxin domain-containing protein [Aliikangiella sp. IMCC44359]|uniref:cupredoxin domain-containing protein n=1 Tax=Aliikangiella sp. IMCC44359 TaxID=3459125 RepID=UPI00403AE6E6
MKQRNQFFRLLIGSFLLFFMPLLGAESYKVGQKNKAFTQKKLEIKKGDTVEFINEDPFFHNVFSLSDAKLFDLGSFPKGESRKVTFEAVGEVEVECAIHPDMLMVIQVKE